MLRFCASNLVGTIPVVIGAPNIQEFAPAPGSILHIKDPKDVPSIAAAMKFLAGSPDEFNKSMRCVS